MKGMENENNSENVTYELTTDWSGFIIWKSCSAVMKPCSQLVYQNKVTNFYYLHHDAPYMCSISKTFLTHMEASVSGMNCPFKLHFLELHMPHNIMIMLILSLKY